MMPRSVKQSLFCVFAFILFSILSLNAQEAIDRINESGKVRIGMTGTQPPYSMALADGSMIGFDADLAALLAAALDVELEIVQMEFDQLIPSLKDGSVDIVISGMTITEKRNREVAFVGPYHMSGMSILTKSADLAMATTVYDLNNKDHKATALAGSTSETYVQSHLTEVEYVPSHDYDDAIAKIHNNEVDILVANYSVVVVNALMDPTEDLVVMEETLTKESIGIALPPHDPLMINLVQNFLNHLKLNGYLEEMESTWFEDGEWTEMMDD
jgi:polar amino acid transport system substrate-binding protein